MLYGRALCDNLDLDSFRRYLSSLGRGDPTDKMGIFGGSWIPIILVILIVAYKNLPFMWHVSATHCLLHPCNYQLPNNKQRSGSFEPC